MTSTEPPAEPGAEPVLITRYPNRRLYDRSRGRYVTLPEIADLVREGRTVTVRDSKSGEDLTRSVLTQIILDQHPERMELLPVNMLNAMIRANEAALSFLRDYLQQSLSYLEWLQRPAAVNPLLMPLPWLRAFLPSAPPPPGASPPAPDADPAALLRRIAELERRLDELQNRPGGAPSAAAPRGRAAGRESHDRKGPRAP
jgi:polyhydroxyalkanoate synthesis repressor PhaR